MQTHSFTHTLFIRELELSVHLGWPVDERQREQIVLLDLDFYFPAELAACFTDDLNDTICYSTLIKEIRTHLHDKKFHLIEHLTHDIYQFIKKQLPAEIKIEVRVSKHPRIQGLGHVCFRCTDKPLC